VALGHPQHFSRLRDGQQQPAFPLVRYSDAIQGIGGHSAGSLGGRS
jgi:hypothetical protein